MKFLLFKFRLQARVKRQSLCSFLRFADDRETYFLQQSVSSIGQKSENLTHGIHEPRKFYRPWILCIRLKREKKNSFNKISWKVIFEYQREKYRVFCYPGRICLWPWACIVPILTILRRSGVEGCCAPGKMFPCIFFVLFVQCFNQKDLSKTSRWSDIPYSENTYFVRRRIFPRTFSASSTPPSLFSSYSSSSLLPLPAEQKVPKFVRDLTLRGWKALRMCLVGGAGENPLI